MNQIIFCMLLLGISGAHGQNLTREPDLETSLPTTDTGVGTGVRTMDYSSQRGFSTMGGGAELEEDIYEADTPLQRGAEKIAPHETSGSGRGAGDTSTSGGL